MAQRFNVTKEVARSLEGTPREALLVLPALAGELMADGDEVALHDLREALAQHVLHQRENHEIANAVSTMVRTFVLHQKAQFNSSR